MVDSWFKQEKRFLYFALFPAIIIIILVGLVPAVYTFYLSLTDLDLIHPPAKFVGFSNYIKLLKNARFIQAGIFTFAFAGVATFTELVYGFLVAYLLADKEISNLYSSIIRTLLLIPYVVAPVVISFIFKTLIYDPTFGYLNYFLGVLHLPVFNIFQGSTSAPIAIFLMEVLLRTPFLVIVCYAGISSIPPSIFEAARIDGASWARQMKDVIIPIIGPIIVVAFIFRFMDALKMFAEIFVVTQGGPGYVTENLTIFITREAFDYFHIGYAAAAAFIFMALVMLVVFPFLKVSGLNRSDVR